MGHHSGFAARDKSYFHKVTPALVLLLSIGGNSITSKEVVEAQQEVLNMCGRPKTPKKRQCLCKCEFLERTSLTLCEEDLKDD